MSDGIYSSLPLRPISAPPRPTALTHKFTASDSSRASDLQKSGTPLARRRPAPAVASEGGSLVPQSRHAPLRPHSALHVPACVGSGVAADGGTPRAAVPETYAAASVPHPSAATQSGASVGALHGGGRHHASAVHYLDRMRAASAAPRATEPLIWKERPPSMQYDLSSQDECSESDAPQGTSCPPHSAALASPLWLFSSAPSTSPQPTAPYPRAHPAYFRHV